MDFDEVVKRRKMIREYDLNRQQIPNQIITKLIKNAHRAPSAGHTQIQEFIIVKDSSTKKKLRKAAVNQEYVQNAPLLIVVCSNTSRSVGRYGIHPWKGILQYNRWCICFYAYFAFCCK